MFIKQQCFFTVRIRVLDLLGHQSYYISGFGVFYKFQHTKDGKRITNAINKGINPQNLSMLADGSGSLKCN